MWRNNGGEADGGLAEGLDIDDPIARDIAQPLFSFSLHSPSVAFNRQKSSEAKNRVSIQNIPELHLRFIK